MSHGAVTFEVAAQEPRHKRLWSREETRRHLNHSRWPPGSHLLEEATDVHARDLEHGAGSSNSIGWFLPEQRPERTCEVVDEFIVAPAECQDQLGRLPVVVASRYVPIRHHVANKLCQLRGPFGWQRGRLPGLVSRSGGHVQV